jgi:O-antigen chain-terminating methyltransferase
VAADAGEGCIVSNNFYRAFEERYYAPRDVIKSIRRQYLPLVEPLAAIYPGGATFDLGCGRGEWLELMSEQGFSPFGVDLDAGMLEACQELGLTAIQGDAVAYLQTMESNSQVLVSAFHVVEHISFEQLQTVVSEALRVLRPGGLLILETPNPENIVVGTNNFYLDPTHQKPIPSLLLSFVVEHGGFETVKTLRLQESPVLRNPDHAVSLLDVIRGASPDYAVIAQKAADPGVKERFSQVFAANYGLSLEALADRYEARADTVRERLGKVESSIQQDEARLQQLETVLQEIKAGLRQSDERFVQTAAELRAVYASSSWQVTWPLRWASIQWRRLREEGARSRIKALIKKFARPVLRGMAPIVRRVPGLRRASHVVLDHMPWIKVRILALFHGHGALTAQSNLPQSPVSVEALTPRAKSIYTDLQAAIRKNKQGEN